MTAESNPMQRSKSTVALLDAYDRLREGKGSATDGKLSVTNVAREAAVSRAAHDLLPDLARPRPPLLALLGGVLCLLHHGGDGVLVLAPCEVGRVLESCSRTTWPS